MTFSEAYKSYPRLRGKKGPIHVRPKIMPLAGFPESHYEHIPGAAHEEDWRSDLRTQALDAFFICQPARGSEGRWLGSSGPAVGGKILDFLRSCAVFGPGRDALSESNLAATTVAPIKYGRLYRGLHLETSEPKRLLRLIGDSVDASAIEDLPSNSAVANWSCERPRKRRKTC